MAIQNVLNGDIAVLNQIISDLREHQANRERFERLNDSIKELNKAIDGIEKNISDEIDSKVKEGVSSVCKGYDTSISEEKAKLKDAYVARDKAKTAGVRQRISVETEELRNSNASLSAQIADAFKEEHIPRFCSNRLFYVLFLTQGFIDSIIFLLFMLVLYGVIPFVMSLIEFIPVWFIIAYYLVTILFMIVCMKRIYAKVVIPHYNTIYKARRAKYEIENNKKKVNNIKKHIRRDRSEDMYDLSAFDYKINEINDGIRDIDSKKEKAMAEFNAATKPAIIKQIHDQYAKSLNEYKARLADNQAEKERIDALIKEQRAYIMSNYEAYLGRDYMDLEVLDELVKVMASNEGVTISQAIALYNNEA